MVYMYFKGGDPVPYYIGRTNNLKQRHSTHMRMDGFDENEFDHVIFTDKVDGDEYMEALLIWHYEPKRNRRQEKKYLDVWMDNMRNHDVFSLASRIITECGSIFSCIQNGWEEYDLGVN